VAVMPARALARTGWGVAYGGTGDREVGQKRE